ncbi:hypothetical protein NW755_012903 [Fusarium falciforme]|uniref:FAD-binding domain-containing protein n=1 Tax=Fusarium falciforme TaxID=195108 RepID=A0A9W8UW21_9HYPO|nr:hypothetical protein NW755_012903 [Fusarium falciforme]KAJ4238318.1 hypothetical protein NW757_013134 [Fusarium falciforme]
MAQDKPFMVVIVGGSIAGLSLASMLQANNIDYVVLETYTDIAPQVGASIGLLPHGNRILDQLGALDRLMTLSILIDNFTFRNDSGNPIAACHDVLYHNIQDKSKVLLGNRVTKVVVTDHDATAITAEGLKYTGDMVVGADGVHSSVRNEMWKIASKLKPGLVRTAEAQEVKCDYTCIFGISKSCPGVRPGDMNSVLRDKASYLAIGGSQGRTYWFRFQKLPKRLYGSEIPRYTPEDVDRTVDSFRHEYILPGV